MFNGKESKRMPTSQQSENKPEYRTCIKENYNNKVKVDCCVYALPIYYLHKVLFMIFV